MKKQSPDASRRAKSPRPTPAAAHAADAPDRSTVAAPAPRAISPAAPVSEGRPELRLAPRARPTIVEAAARSGCFATLVAALHGAGMTDLLAGSGPFTLFAPTDRAFTRLPDGVLDALLRDTAWLERVLTSHLVAGQVTSPQPGVPSPATSVGGSELNVTVHDGTYRVNGARIVRPHARASNGMIRGIDTVLLRH
ncbi:MAG TPA: fasciclin domain-containing protein [Gemmatimonadaceae bacterium]|nr:fasciclin domain-containing protein [Gemmatimonadaceae bacterium]